MAFVARENFSSQSGAWDLDKDDEAEAEFRRVQERHPVLDHAGLFQRPDAAPAGIARQVDRRAKRLKGLASVALQFDQYAAVDVIKCRHCASLVGNLLIGKGVQGRI